MEMRWYIGYAYIKCWWMVGISCSDCVDARTVIVYGNSKVVGVRGWCASGVRSKPFAICNCFSNLNLTSMISHYTHCCNFSCSCVYWNGACVTADCELCVYWCQVEYSRCLASCVVMCPNCPSIKYHLSGFVPILFTVPVWKYCKKADLINVYLLFAQSD